MPPPLRAPQTQQNLSTFLSSKLTFLSCKLTFLSSRGRPFDAGWLPLSYSGNPGVKWRSKMTFAPPPRERGSLRAPDLGEGQRQQRVDVIQRAADTEPRNPCEIRRLRLGCHGNSGVTSRHRRGV